ncbi:MAG: branched-chain amino acid ABC transporter permease [SAR324 cluster bacterium]
MSSSLGWKIGVTAALLGVLAAVVPFVNGFVLLLLTKTLVFGILAMSVDLLIGFTGLASMGQAAYLAVGAYLAAILSVRYGIGLGCDFFAVLAGGLVLGAVLAMVFGLLALRAAGVYFLMITLALGMVVWGLAYRWNSLTGGDNGINLPGWPVCGVSYRDPVAYYYLVCALFVAVLAGLFILVRSPFGLTLLGIRESETRMRILGYNTWLHKYLIFVIAGGCGGMAGVLWAHVNQIVSPQDALLTNSVDALLMVILGGSRTLVGAVIGAAIVLFVREYLSTFVTWWLYVLGTDYILTIYYMPEGILGAVLRLGRRRRAGGVGGLPAAASASPRNPE